MLTFWACLAAFLLAFCQAVFPETIKLRSKQDLQGAVIGLEDGNLILKSGQRLPRESVEEIVFTEGKSVESEKSEVTPDDRRRARELFRQAAEFGKEHPGMDGLILVDHGEYRLKEDGTQVYRYHFVGQVQKESMKEAWGTVIDWLEEGRSKAEIVKLAVALRVPLELTWSCYEGGKAPCGRCDSCRLRAKGFARAGYEDPLLARPGREGRDEG